MYVPREVAQVSGVLIPEYAVRAKDTVPSIVPMYRMAVSSHLPSSRVVPTLARTLVTHPLEWLMN